METKGKCAGWRTSVCLMNNVKVRFSSIRGQRLDEVWHGQVSNVGGKYPNHGPSNLFSKTVSYKGGISEGDGRYEGAGLDSNMLAMMEWKLVKALSEIVGKFPRLERVLMSLSGRSFALETRTDKGLLMSLRAIHLLVVFDT